MTLYSEINPTSNLDFRRNKQQRMSILTIRVKPFVAAFTFGLIRFDNRIFKQILFSKCIKRRDFDAQKSIFKRENENEKELPIASCLLILTGNPSEAFKYSLFK